MLAGATTEGVILDCVPPGTYRWSLQPGILMSMIRYPAQVGPVLDVRGRIDLRIDFQACAALEILLRDESGAGYSGIASFRIGALRGGRLDAGTAFAMFEKAPYRLMGLPAGEYEVALEQPPSAAGGSASTLRVSLAEGQRESIALVVRPP